MTSQLRSVETKRSNKVTLIFELFYFDLSIVCNRDLTLFLDFFFQYVFNSLFDFSFETFIRP